MTERSSCLSASEVPLSAELEKLGSGACNGRLALNKCGIERIDIVRRYSEAIANIIRSTIRRHRYQKLGNFSSKLLKISGFFNVLIEIH